MGWDSSYFDDSVWEAAESSDGTYHYGIWLDNAWRYDPAKGGDYSGIKLNLKSGTIAASKLRVFVVNDNLSDGSDETECNGVEIENSQGERVVSWAEYYETEIYPGSECEAEGWPPWECDPGYKSGFVLEFPPTEDIARFYMWPKFAVSQQTYVTGIDFWTLKPSPPVPDNDYSRAQMITVKKEAVTGFPQNIPVMVEYDGATVDVELLYALTMNEGEGRIKVTAAEENGAEYPCETGVVLDGKNVLKVRLFFHAPKLSSTEDNYFYLFYGKKGDSTRLSNFQPRDVWVNKRDKVWHYQHDVIRGE